MRDRDVKGEDVKGDVSPTPTRSPAGRRALDFAAGFVSAVVLLVVLALIEVRQPLTVRCVQAVNPGYEGGEYVYVLTAQDGSRCVMVGRAASPGDEFACRWSPR